VDDVTKLLSSGWSSLTSVAAVAATTATTVVKSGVGTVSQTLQEKQVGVALTEGTKVVSEKGMALAQTGWTGLKSIYATVASTVETAAKESGYNLNLGGWRAREGRAGSAERCLYEPCHAVLCCAAGIASG
jgi:hypothetical protein